MLADTLAAAGHAVEWADPAEIPGRARFHVADPWGNRLELLAPLDLGSTGHGAYSATRRSRDGVDALARAGLSGRSTSGR